MEEKGSGVQGRSQLHNELEAILGYMKTLSQITTTIVSQKTKEVESMSPSCPVYHTRYNSKEQAKDTGLTGLAGFFHVICWTREINAACVVWVLHTAEKADVPQAAHANRSQTATLGQTIMHRRPAEAQWPAIHMESGSWEPQHLHRGTQRHLHCSPRFRADFLLCAQPR